MFVNFTVLVECDKMLTANNCHMLPIVITQMNALLLLCYPSRLMLQIII